MGIATECMIINLQQGSWEGRKLDREASKRVNTDSGATGDVARVNKLIIQKEALSGIVSKHSAIYSHYRLHTLPWKDNGDRLLSRKMYARFIEGHEQLVADFNVEVTKFIDVTYPAERARAEFRMGNLFKPEDYPAAEELRGKFYNRMTIDAVAEAQDFRVKMSDEKRGEIQAQIESNMAERINKVMAQVWANLAKHVEHFAERMKSEGGRLHDSARDNLLELCDILPGLNILNDPDLKRIGLEIKQRVSAYDMKELRHPKKGPALKAQAATEADEIIEQMRGFMTALGGLAPDEE